MARPYRLELCDNDQAVLAFLDDVDQGSVNVSEALNGRHTLSFRLPYENTTVVNSLQPRQFVRLTDLRQQTAATSITAVNSSVGVVVNDTSGFQAGQLVRSTLHGGYLSRIVSINASGSGFILSRLLGEGADKSNYYGTALTSQHYDLYRVARTEVVKEGGVYYKAVQCQHISYDLDARPYFSAGRFDLSFSQWQAGGASERPVTTASSMVNDVLSNFRVNQGAAAMETGGFFASQIDPTGYRQTSVNRESCLGALRNAANTFEADLQVRSDYSVDLLHFLGQASELVVEYPSSLNSVRKEEDGSAMYNVIYPVGAKNKWQDSYSGVTGQLEWSGSPVQDRTTVSLVSGQGARFRAGDVVALYKSAAFLVVDSGSGDTINYNAVTSTSGTITAGQLLGAQVILFSVTPTNQRGQVREVVQHYTSSTTAGIIVLDRPINWFGSDSLTGGSLLVSSDAEITEVVGHLVATKTVDSLSTSTVLFIKQAAEYTTVNQYQTGLVEILTGAGAGQIRQISANGIDYIQVDAGHPFDTVPADGDLMRVRAHPGSSDVLTVGKLSSPANDGTAYNYLVKIWPEEPLTVGKDYSLRSSVGSWYVPPSGTDPTTVKLANATDAQRFTDVTSNTLWPIQAWTVKISELTLNYSTAIPQFCSLESKVISVPDPASDVIILDSEPLSRYPDNYVPSNYADIEVLSLGNSEAVAKYGEIKKLQVYQDCHSPRRLYELARVDLTQHKEPTRNYQIDFGNMYDFDSSLFPYNQVNVGDVFQLRDRTVSLWDQQTHFVLLPAFYTYSTDAATTYARLDMASSILYNFHENELRGRLLRAVDANNTYPNEIKVIRTNTQSFILIDKLSYTPTNTNLAILTADSGFRVVQKSWNPFDPSQLDVRVSTQNNYTRFASDRVQFEQRTKQTLVEAEQAVNSTKYPKCYYWDETKKACQRSNYPNVFCGSAASNRDGRTTAELKPITRAHCSAFSPFAPKALPLENKILRVDVASIPGNFGTVAVTLTPAQVPFVADGTVSEHVIIDIFPSDDPAAPENPADDKIGIEFLKDANDNFKPSDDGTGYGGTVIFTNNSTSASDYMSGSAFISLSGGDS